MDDNFTLGIVPVRMCRVFRGKRAEVRKSCWVEGLRRCIPWNEFTDQVL